MRYVTVLLALSLLLPSRPVFAQADPGTRLYGSWRMVSFQVKVVGEDGPGQEIFGSHPFGRIILTPQHYVAAFLSRPDRKPPANPTDAAALLSTMVAYTGKFRIEGDKFITTVDGAWNEIYKANEQVRYFTFDGDKVILRTAEQPSGTMPGKRVVATTVWEPEK